jgi:hypothetical protein
VDRGLAQHHIGRRLVTSFVYELPFGCGRGLLNRGGVVDAVLGGWQVSSILTFADGTPRNGGEIGDITNTGISSRRCNRDQPVPGKSNAAAFWNIAAFDANNPELRYSSAIPGGPCFLIREHGSGTSRSPKSSASPKVISSVSGWKALPSRITPTGTRPGATLRQPNTFGVIHTAGTMREMQLGLKYNF